MTHDAAKKNTASTKAELPLTDVILHADSSNTVDFDNPKAKTSVNLNRDPIVQEAIRLGVLRNFDEKLTRYQKEKIAAGRGADLVIADRYLVLQRIGDGGMGRVYLCEHRVMRNKVAIKMLSNRHARDPVRVARFEREARAAAALNHPNIVRAFELDHKGHRPFMVMEHVVGINLHDLINRDGPLEFSNASDIIRQAAIGLSHAHQAGLIHRDVKPSNIMLTKEGVVKVLDLGLARFASDTEDQLTIQQDESAVLGTADFIAPEQAMRGYQADERSDIYSLGYTYYFLLAGQVPYPDRQLFEKLTAHQEGSQPNIQLIRPDIPQETVELISRMTDRNPENRIQSMLEISQQLSPTKESANHKVFTAMIRESQMPTAVEIPAVNTRQNDLRWISILMFSLFFLGFSSFFLYMVLKKSNKPEAIIPKIDSKQVEVNQKSNEQKNLETLNDGQFAQAIIGLDRNDYEAAIKTRLIRKNPGLMAEMVEFEWLDSSGIGIELPAEKIKDISPLRAVADLTAITCKSENGNGILADIRPLRGLKKLISVDFKGNSQINDISALKEMPISTLNIEGTSVNEIPFLPSLQALYAGRTRIRSLSSLSDCSKLQLLYIEETSIENLSPIENCPIRNIQIMKTEISNLSALKGKDIYYANISNTQVENIKPLANDNLHKLVMMNGTRVKDLKPLEKCSNIKELEIQNSLVEDWSPIEKLPLEVLRYDWGKKPPQQLLDIIKDHKTLKKINDMDPDSYLKKHGS